MKDFILKRMAAIILPFICVYGFYVILHGHVSPGGSFAGGIIVGLSLIAYSTIYGIAKGRAKLPEKVLVWTESYGTLWYGLMGMVGIVKGVPFLANKLAGVNLGNPGTLSSGGLISLIGFGVGIRVASTMVTLFFTMMEE
ncbi:MAG TPA: sodium:proton antiporter [Firmicutes bacterium]|jgi:multicomponent Na+:H+ antiporter subunit B|nr:sodium:proton antiporter [Bacillota bacterium]HCF88530.1 sodium:proton antiporter [Bacillota bacterium]HCF90919.1 sodium:proton antiporter [Bacillota bacterium]HCT37608.1 sodium:proton antiporter [Bacillota bacterium]